MTNISKTLFIPFYFKYKESIGEKTLYEKEAVDFFSDNSNLNIIDFRKVEKEKNSFVGVLARTKLVDSFLLNLINSKNINNIFNIGAGLDFRNRRLKISHSWYNIDLPEVIKFRNTNFTSNSNEKNIIANIFDTYNWNFIPYETNIFIFEGVLIYFNKEQIINIIKNLSEKSKKAYFIFDTCPEEVVTLKQNSVKAIKNKVQIQWGTNNASNFFENSNLKCLESKRWIDLYPDRWDLDVVENETLRKSLNDNLKVHIFESKK